MSQSALTYALSNVRNCIPKEMLELAFKPREYNTTIEQRIISEIIEGPIILDINLVGGKRRKIILNAAWEMDMGVDNDFNMAGIGIQGSYYKIPEDAREGRNIASVIGITPTLVSSLPSSGTNYNGSGSFGNTALGLSSAMLNTRTFAQYPIMPEVTLEGTNIIRFYPKQLIDGCAIDILLEYDTEFLNMERSAIKALSDLVLCAVQRYIANNLKITVDETEVVAGMELGVIKELLTRYEEKGEQYDDLLRKCKGAMHYDARSISRLIYHAL